MSAKRFLSFLSVPAAILLAAGLSATAQPQAGADAKPFKPVQPLETMMEGQGKLFKEIKEAIADKKWKEGATAAWILAEIANANHYQKNDPAYQKFADEVSSKSAELARKLRAKDEAGAKQLYSQIGNTCNSCHDQFKKKD